MDDGLRMLAVHAHADDESITMGTTLARYADEGVRVVNVCCTDGQLATIVDPEMAAREAEIRPRLGEVRREELRAACAELGVSDVRFLGYHDSGMAGEPTNTRPEAFWMQPLDTVAGRLVEVIREVRPQVVVTYDGNGAYGHPDHVQAHRATLLAVEAAYIAKAYPDGGDPWRVSKLYYTAFPLSEARKIVQLAESAGMPPPFGDTDPEELEFVAPDEMVTTSIEGRAVYARKLAALRAHRSQIGPDFPYLSVPEEMGREIAGTEFFSLAFSRVPVRVPEDDLFAGLR